MLQNNCVAIVYDNGKEIKRIDCTQLIEALNYIKIIGYRDTSEQIFLAAIPVNYIVELREKREIEKEQIIDDQKRFNQLDSEEFYDLLQSYRISNILDQSEVTKRFREIKEWIKKNL